MSTAIRRSHLASAGVLINVLCALVLCGCHSPERKMPLPASSALEMEQGGIIRGPVTNKRIALVFTGHEFAEGASVILDDLAKREIMASFFLTGTFLTHQAFTPLLQRMRADGHYVGPHSDQHLLYCAWGPARTTLVTRSEFTADLSNNVEKLAAHGLKWQVNAHYFLPPFEHYNAEIASWSASLGWTLINYTPGTRSNADYTGEADGNFVSSQVIFQSIVHREHTDPHGLNGFLLLLHLGSGPGRTDKFHDRLGDLLDLLLEKGYQFVRVDELIGGHTHKTHD